MAAAWAGPFRAASGARRGPVVPCRVGPWWPERAGADLAAASSSVAAAVVAAAAASVAAKRRHNGQIKMPIS